MTPPVSDHFNGKTFVQPGSYRGRHLGDVLRWKMTSRPTQWPRHVELAAQPAPPAPTGNEIVATWLGHATYLVQSISGNLLFDPVFSERVSPFPWIGPRRVHATPLRLEALPRIDAVCVSHDHYDHFDQETLQRIARTSRAVFITPLRHRDLLNGIADDRIIELDWWQSFQLPGGAEVTLTPTKHWSNRLGSPRNYRLWGGFFVKYGGRGGTALGDGGNGTHAATLSDTTARRLWFVGDTGYDRPMFQEIRQRRGAPDVALVPIGAYEPRWFMAPMHMNPGEAVQLHCDIGARVSLAMHWGTFQLTDEGRDEPVRALVEAKAAKGVPDEAFRVMAPGESMML